MIKQFNFYDIYGYLLPGMLFLGLLWVPFGVTTQTWPDQDISKAIFLVLLAYVVGHILQTIANSVVPSTITDSAKQRRFPSDLLLDKSNPKFSNEFKNRLAGQVSTMFGLDLGVTQDGNGKSQISSSRQTAFFQARSYLNAKKATQYAEQFEGLYVMMRGLGCAFVAGAAFFAGWADRLALRRGNWAVWSGIPMLLGAAITLALISSLIAYFHEPAKKAADRLLAAFLLLTLATSGFLAAAWRFQPAPSAIPFSNSAESVLWAGALLALLAGARCFSAYKGFAHNFAETIWRDFSANLSIPELPACGGNDDE